MAHLRLWESKLMLTTIIRRDFALIISSLSHPTTQDWRYVCLSFQELFATSTSLLVKRQRGSQGWSCWNWVRGSECSSKHHTEREKWLLEIFIWNQFISNLYWCYSWSQELSLKDDLCFPETTCAFMTVSFERREAHEPQFSSNLAEHHCEEDGRPKCKPVCPCSFVKNGSCIFFFFYYL